MEDTGFFTGELLNEMMEGLQEESRFTATYRIEASDYLTAKDIAFGLAVEQTVECPYEIVKDSWIGKTIVGHIVDLKKAGTDSAYYATISYAQEAVNGEFTEFLNMLFGNSSLQPGIRLMSFELPDRMYDCFSGPKFGRAGIRELCGTPEGPVFMSAVKPLGTSAKDLARMVSQLAMGGCPIIKDDHSLYDQSWAPFEERVRRCAEAVDEANAKSGGSSIYVANCSGDGLAFLDRAYKAQELGADGILAAPSIIGLSLVRQLAEAGDFRLPIFFHPCFSGFITMHRDSGISPFCYYGQIARLAGADASIFTSFGGRFTYDRETCRRIVDGTEINMGVIKSAFPVPSGGMKWQLFPEMCRVYGDDVIFLVGGALQTEGPDLTENTRFFMEKLREARQGRAR